MNDSSFAYLQKLPWLPISVIFSDFKKIYIYFKIINKYLNFEFFNNNNYNILEKY